MRITGRRTAIVIACVATMVVGVAAFVYWDRLAEQWYIWKLRSSQLTFSSWDLGIKFLQWRHLIPPGTTRREEVKIDSIIDDINISPFDFRVIYLDWRGESQFGIRGRNGPIYVFNKKEDSYKLVGGFLGSHVDIENSNHGPVLLLYYHISAAGDPPTKYSFIGEIFNEVSPEVRGDVFK